MFTQSEMLKFIVVVFAIDRNIKQYLLGTWKYAKAREKELEGLLVNLRTNHTSGKIRREHFYQEIQ